MRFENKKKIAVIHGNDGSDVRIGKICRSLSTMGYDTNYIGWDRRPSERKRINLGNTKLHIINYETKFGKSTFKGRLVFARHICRILKTIKPYIVYAVNEDTAIMLVPLKGLLYKILVCDVFDALVDRHSENNRIIVFLLKVVSFFARLFSDELIATDQTRFNGFGRFKSKTIIVENVPEDPGDDIVTIMPHGPIKIYVSGSLNINRGIKQIIEIADKIDDLEIISAGWLYDDYANNVFVKHPKVVFKGIITARESLKLAAECDAILSYYSPMSLNNILASPNKIYDAMSVGRPLIINSEIKIAEYVGEYNLGYLCPWGNIDKLEEIILNLKSNREKLSNFASNSRKIFLNGHNWNLMAQRMYEMLNKIAKLEN
ncbi:MAG: hypothetical protein U5O15_10685 [Candidatus Krumholzibacteriota bacterium]|nr:hypothetical protein [Candidatus Krumholzibacteriota bacterium]